MNKVTAIVLGFVVIFQSAILFAQQAENKDILSQFKKIGEMFSEDGDLQKNLSVASGSLNENTNQNLDLDQETLQKLISIRNPFESQLPQPGQAVSKTETQVAPEPVGMGPEPTPPQPKIIPSLPQCSITGLVWDSQKPQAILNGKIIGLGDKIESWTVTQITKDGVEITFENEKFLIGRKGMPGANSATRNPYGQFPQGTVPGTPTVRDSSRFENPNSGINIKE